ncbi:MULTISPECIES: hypothetical protein [Paenibacillus]|uniref:hypothetical protein n=1 Tax=Paenibacillus TaxID=44249 RepID=UPI0022B897E6|nr:hypothetical protein [Paenibacillus caseinilyticus]MCZ8521971.1 hypothetical protein [Paenibacillus caseinilyticus]
MKTSNRSKAMIGSLVLLAVLAAGCGTKQETAPASGVQGAAEAGSTAAGQTKDAAGTSKDTAAAGRPAMNDKAFAMMSTFRALIQLDGQEGLSLTKEQAEAMLPVVQSSISASELTEENKAKLTGALTAEQKAFLDKAASQRQGGGRNRPADGGAGAADGGTAPQEKPDGSAGTSGSGTASGSGKASTDGKAPAADGAAKPDGTADGRPAKGGGGQGMNGGKNAGEQLTALLQARIGQ